MARPSQNRTITKRYRVNAEEDRRISQNAAESGMDESKYQRHCALNKGPLTTGKGMSRQEHLNCLSLIARAKQIIAGHKILTEILDKLADSHYKATKDDKQGA